jgi:hypothetical protein
MQTKLTLSIDKTVISRAKTFARGRKKSLSKIIEDYLKSLSVPNESDESTISSLPPISKSLAGILKGKPEVDYKSTMADYLVRKHK